MVDDGEEVKGAYTTGYTVLGATAVATVALVMM